MLASNFSPFHLLYEIKIINKREQSLQFSEEEEKKNPKLWKNTLFKLLNQ